MIKELQARAHRPRGDAGVTLVEILMATLVLAVLAVAGGAHLYHARAMVAMQRNRLVATELSSGRMEQIRLIRPVEISPPGTGQYFLAISGTNWALSASDPLETATLNRRSYPMRSTVEWLNHPTLDTNRCLKISVTTFYRPESGAFVRLNTLLTP